MVRLLVTDPETSTSGRLCSEYMEESVGCPFLRPEGFNHVKKFAVVAIGVFASAAIFAPSAFGATSDEVTPAEAASALAGVPGLLAASDTVKSSSDGDSAATSQINGTTVDIPKDADDGIDLGGRNGGLSITPSSTAADGPGTTVAPGTVAYPASDGAATAVQAAEDGGGARVLTVINSPEAPSDYPYKIDVPGGGAVRLSDDGGAVVVDQSGSAIATIKAPWAKAADGKVVPTRFTTDGATLTQHIDHAGAAYPVVADPWFWNYMGCITGIGVPIGAAIVIASYPPSWWAVQRMASGTLATGRVNGLMMYANWVGARCGAFLRS